MYEISKEIFKTCDNNDNGELIAIVLRYVINKKEKYDRTKNT